MRIDDIETRLTADGVPFSREFDWDDGWALEVEGDVVGRGASIGGLEAALDPWWEEYLRRATRGERAPEAGPALFDQQDGEQEQPAG
jgi:hypothetical protein